MGDFYETFYEDAKTCSKVLGLTLTSRSKGTNPIPLAGVPYHAIDGYLKKMLQAGYKVAVCEQVEDPKTAKGVVKRDVVRIVTPGTLTDDMLLDAKEDNFLCAVSLGTKRQAAISWVDISTGHFFAQQLSEEKLVDELHTANQSHYHRTPQLVFRSLSGKRAPAEALRHRHPRRLRH
jgi:DNA mismatch repair protein MutS